MNPISLRGFLAATAKLLDQDHPDIAYILRAAAGCCTDPQDAKSLRTAIQAWEPDKPLDLFSFKHKFDP